MMPKRAPAQQAELFKATDLPEGFRYCEDVLTAEEERRLVAHFAALAFRPFEFHGYLGNRRIVSFGYRYDYSEREVRSSAAFPDFLHGLREVAANVSGLGTATLQQALVTEYAPGAGTGWHRDKPMFAEVVAFSFLASCRLRFRRRRGAGWERCMQLLSPRSAYVLAGPARWEWEHSIPPGPQLRYSVTFRNFVSERR